MTRTLAALASIPRRAAFLPGVLRSLRPQVDTLCVYLNGWDTVPDCVRDMADEFFLSPENDGAERKLHWAAQHDGVYLSCDDDFEYPADYAATMVREVRRWDGKAIVAAHGRCYRGRPSSVHDVAGPIGFFYKRVDCGRWINHGGTGVMAWDTSSVNVPTNWEHRNIIDLQLAIWAQQNRVPMWLVPHKAGWFNSLADLDPKGIFVTSRSEGHRRRNEMLRSVHAWQVFPQKEPCLSSAGMS